jgi:glycosyltransferase involved in cell wall biosynthesis
MPQVSCIVPAYNAQAYLRQTLESVLAQSGAELEVIVVDDGSVDRTAKIAASFGQQIQFISQANAGVTAARNRGLDQARGEYIAFMDADDLCRPNKLALQLAAFAADPNLEMCAGHVQNFSGDLNNVGEPIPGYNTDMLIRRDLFDRIGYFKPALHHAARLEWMLRARAARTIEHLLPEVLIYRRLHSNNMSYLQANQSLSEHLRVLHASLKQRPPKH